MLDFCTTILAYFENITLLSMQQVNNCLRYQAVKSVCPFQGQLRPLLGNASELLQSDLSFMGLENFASVNIYIFLPPSWRFDLAFTGLESI
jgi:hypothetical protein